MSKEAQEKLIEVLRRLAMGSPRVVTDSAIKELADQLTTDEQTAYEERMGEGA